MCLVEIKGSLKPLIACCILFNKNMIIYTNINLVTISVEFQLLCLTMYNIYNILK